jgi:hypothetical protein
MGATVERTGRRRITFTCFLSQTVAALEESLKCDEYFGKGQDIRAGRVLRKPMGKERRLPG